MGTHIGYLYLVGSATISGVITNYYSDYSFQLDVVNDAPVFAITPSYPTPINLMQTGVFYDLPAQIDTEGHNK